MDDMSRLLRKVTAGLLAVNKVDNAMREKDAIEFYNLGLGEYYTLPVFLEVEQVICWMH
jgi:GTP-binding protein